MNVFLISFFITINFAVLAQTNNTKKKQLCNPLVLGQPITKLATIGIENQFKSNLISIPQYLMPTTTLNSTINSINNFRANLNKNVIVKPKTYLNIGVNYLYTNFNTTTIGNIPLNKIINNNGYTSMGFTANLFKPLNSKNFILFNAALDANGNTFSNFNGSNIYFSGTLIYGWKKALKSMVGIGVTRTYRLGRVVHVPVLLWNETFNKKWGIDMVLPARANVRYTPKAGQMLTMGFELEGAQYRLQGNDLALNNTFLQRGEIRTKIGYDKKINNNSYFSATAGYRIMQRFDIADSYNSKTNTVNNTLKPAPFLNVGYHITKFNKVKKGKK